MGFVSKCRIKIKMDVKNIFLHRELEDREIYMNQENGFENVAQRTLRYIISTNTTIFRTKEAKTTS